MGELAKNATKSWRTTAYGIVAFVAALAVALKALLDNDPATVANWDLVVLALLSALGLSQARDNNVTSEDAGAGD